MRTIGIGLIGWGFMGKTHTHALRCLPLFYNGADFRVRLVSVCSRRLEKAKEAAEDMGFERYTDDYHELLNDPEIEVVSICTPNDMHEQMVLDALASGKHIYLDKPVAVTADSADRMAEAASKHPECLTQMVFNNRYMTAMLRARELMQEDRIGEVLSFETRFLHSGSIDPNKPIGWKQQMQGGVLLDMGSHVLDLLTLLVGYPKRVFAKSRVLFPSRPTKDGGIETNLSEDQMLAILELDNGAIGTLEASKIATGSDDELYIEVRGTKGALRWNSMDPSYLEFYDNTLPEKALGGDRGFTRIECVGRYPKPGGAFLPPKNAVGWDRGHIHCYYTFLDCVAHGRKPENTIEDAAKLQRLMEAMQASAANNIWVDFK